MTDQPPVAEQPDDQQDDTDPYEEIIDFYQRLAAQHVGRCVYHAPNP